MNIMVWTLLPLLVMALCWHEYFVLRGKNRRMLRIGFKCTATLMAGVTAFTGLLEAGEMPLLSPVFWGIMFCMLGDGLLAIHFVSGMAAFGVAHFCLIGWIYGLYGMTGGIAPVTLVIWVLAYAGTVWAFRGHIRKLGKAKIAFLLYPAVLMAMAAMAATFPFRFGLRAWSIAAGGVLFAVSDLFVAKGVFSGISLAWDKFALAIYYLAVYCFALTMWLL